MVRPVHAHSEDLQQARFDSGLDAASKSGGSTSLAWSSDDRLRVVPVERR
jgi:hypothetical protein